MAKNDETQEAQAEPTVEVKLHKEVAQPYRAWELDKSHGYSRAYLWDKSNRHTQQMTIADARILEATGDPNFVIPALPE